MSAPTVGQLGQYRLVGVLGSGGMGTVYLGRSPGGRPVAVKAVHGHLALNPDFRTRFRREVALARRVGGPFTAAMLDADPDGDPPWLATEYIRGQSLAQVLTEHGALPEHTVRALAAGLAEALQVIHAAGVVHRDLKPSNVLLSENGPRVIDFGIAKAVEGIDLTGDGPLLGTPGYMSPEHLYGRVLAPSSDVFSLGAVLAHAATGVAPFGAGQSFAVANRVTSAPPDLSGLPSGLADLIGRCLAKDPAERPSLQWIVGQVGSFAEQDSWLPSEVGNAIRHRPAETRPFTSADVTPPGASDEPLDFVAYLADRFSRRAGGAPIAPISASRGPSVPIVRPAKASAGPGAAAGAAAGTAAPAPAAGPQAAPPAQAAQVAVAKLRDNLQGAAARLKAAAARPPSPAPAAPPHQRAPWNPNAAPLKQPRRVPWQRLQCPPIGTVTGRRAWSRWLLVLVLLGLLDALAQAPFVRQLVVAGELDAPPWLSGAFEVSRTISGATDWLPDVVTDWATGNHTLEAGVIAGRLAVVPLFLLLCVALIRRGGTSTPMMVAKTAAGWLGTAVAVLLACRYVVTGFASLLWAVATLRWWFVPTALVVAFVTKRLAGPPR